MEIGKLEDYKRGEVEVYGSYKEVPFTHFYSKREGRKKIKCVVEEVEDLAITYAQCHNASYASHLFDKLPQPSLFSWNAMMRMYVQIGRPLDALNLFVEMLELGQTLPDKFTYPVVIKACADLSLIDAGVGIHGQTLKYGFASDTFVQNTLLAMFSIACSFLSRSLNSLHTNDINCLDTVILSDHFMVLITD
ncbi:Pentatricopeptide repeat-containing protein [Spatholobus suberectus]|nr:Pentatricopeptide repeat-containing protein [Spatholobus suberectus]